MKLTVCFPSNEIEDHTYGIVWIPGPCWIKSGGSTSEPHDDILVNMADGPHYRVGGVARLMKVVPELPRPGDRGLASTDVVIVVHPLGHGRWEDVQELQRDLVDQGYHPVVVQPSFQP